MVPFKMPLMEMILSPARPSLTVRTTGMAPATAASKSRSTPLAWASSSSWPPWVASRALLPVTTLAPEFRAVVISSRAGLMPPISSMTRSHEPARAMESVVNRLASGCQSRLASSERTPIPTSSSFSPTAFSRRSLSWVRMRATWAPTVPRPSKPIRTLILTSSPGR